MMFPASVGGEYIALADSRNTLSAAARAAGVRLVSMPSVSVCRMNGGGFTGYGCVSAARSPSSVEGGTLRYAIGKSGVPVARSNTYTYPVFVICATASTFFRSRVTVTRVGGAGRSQSHRSCFTV
jgi:hypothetical protein